MGTAETMKGVHPYRTTLWHGSVHAQASQARRDSRRDAHLKKTGYVVLRFSNGIVQEAPDIFVQKILDAVWSLPEAFG